MGRRKKFGFSWKRASGLTAAKRKIAKATGIPTTKSGRQRKMGRALGCAPMLAGILFGTMSIGGFIAGCGPSIAERQAVYATAKEILEKEKVELASLRAQKSEIAERELNLLEAEILEKFDAENRPGPDEKDYKKHIEFDEKRRRFSLDMTTKHIDLNELGKRTKSATVEVCKKIEEQESRVKRAEKMLADAEANLPK
jgi:hypothetical protein